MFPTSINENFNDVMAYVEKINRLNHGTSCALYVIQGDRVIAEHYAGRHGTPEEARRTSAASQYNVASVRKSYIGFAAAWAQHAGAIAFDDEVLRYVSPDKEERAVLDKVTVRHLLTHTHGLIRGADGQLQRRFAPGTDWQYNNVGIGLLTQLLPETLGCSIAELLRKHVFDPLGFTETGWRSAPSELLVPVIDKGNNNESRLYLDGCTDGSEGNMFVSARELAWWGYLHLKFGRMKGTSLIPEAVIRSATTVQSPAGLPANLPHNGCLWLVKSGESPQCLIGPNVPQHAFEIVGLYGPLVLVVPELDLVVVRMANTCGNYEDEHGSYVHYLKQFADRAVAAARKPYSVAPPSGL
ncbi:serine hydrolase domain-containing protein [Paenibacillus thalictri]|uniref:Class A beta-lactamase-related serine hydrolase n=1 Tax=Paenibacillus thalictri TaxID=2527873 RepID=A0A4Q9DRH4_9BACL|nr:serine hydrolase domain-containing protein [Paenibacillus thalictri]TBL76279.1 class A beta-lactamase-related serine hydrolase [Paenibacillus thalictri]